MNKVAGTKDQMIFSMENDIGTYMYEHCRSRVIQEESMLISTCYVTKNAKEEGRKAIESLKYH